MRRRVRVTDIEEEGFRFKRLLLCHCILHINMEEAVCDRKQSLSEFRGADRNSPVETSIRVSIEEHVVQGFEAMRR